MRNRNVVSVVAVGMLLALAARGEAALVLRQLGIMIDGSQSISSSDFSLQLDGIAGGLSNHVPTDGTIELSIVQFGTFATLELGPTVIDSQTALDDFTTSVLAISQVGGLTDMGGAIDLMSATLLGSPNAAGALQIMNLSTDGNPTTGPDPVTSAANARAAGIDALSAEGVDDAVDLDFLASLVYPGVSPGPIISGGDPLPDPLLQGFVVEIASFADYGPVIDEKIERVIPGPPVPEPSSVFVFAGLGIGAVIGQFVRRRMRA